MNQEELLEKLAKWRDGAVASAKYYKDKSLADYNYHQGRRDGYIEAINLMKRLGEGLVIEEINRACDGCGSVNPLGETGVRLMTGLVVCDACLLVAEKVYLSPRQESN